MEKTTIFTPREISLYLFLKENKYYRIPDFQRSYTWNEEKIVDMITSVIDATKENQLFLGTVYFFSSDSIFNITDGQQRIVSLFLSINAIRLLKLHKVDKFLYDSNYKPYIDIYESVPLHNKLFKITELTEIDDIKENLNDITLTKLQIIENQMAIYNFFEENPDLGEKFILGLKNSYFILIDVPKEKSVYRIFRNINSKGAPLSNIDIIKNAFFEVIPSETGVSTEKQFKYENWKKIENNLLIDKRELKNDLLSARKILESNMSVTLQWYLSFVIDKYIPLTDFNLASEYEIYLKLPMINAKKTIKNLCKFSNSSSYVLFPTQKSPSQNIPKLIHQYLIMLYNIDLKQHIPIFLALYYKLIEKNTFQNYKDEIISFCNKFYLFHFLFTTLISDRGSKIGKNYAKQALSIFNETNLDFDIVYKFQKANLPTKEAIFDGIEKRLFYIKDNRDRVKFIKQQDKEYRFFRGVDQIRDFLMFFEYIIDENLKTINGVVIDSIEHIFDADIEYSNFDNFKLMSFLPLEVKLNSECQDKTFQEKVTIYKKSKYKMTQKFVQIVEEIDNKNVENVRKEWRDYLYQTISSVYDL